MNQEFKIAVTKTTKFSKYKLPKELSPGSLFVSKSKNA